MTSPATTPPRHHGEPAMPPVLAAAPPPPPVVDVAALTAAAVRVGRTQPEQRWYGGPVALPREHKGYVVDLADYLAWLDELERATTWDVDEFVQRVRLLYYGRATGNALFDAVLDTSGDTWVDTPVTTADVPQRTLDNLFRTGAVRVRRDLPPVDLSHLWVLADRARNGLTCKAHAVDTGLADVTGLLSWTGDLCSWWSEWNDARMSARRAALAAGTPLTAPPFVESADPAAVAAVPLPWLDQAVTARCAADDLIGDIDAVVLMKEFAKLKDPSPTTSQTPVTDLLRSYYDLAHPPADRTAVHCANRFHLFLARVVPGIADEEDGAGGPGARALGATAAEDIRKAVRKAAFALLYTSRYRRARFHTEALDAFPEAHDSVVHDLPGIGRIRFAEIDREIDHELDSPWGAAVLKEIADRFAAWLRAGLTGDGWVLNGWPLVDPLARWGGGPLMLGARDPAPGPDGAPGPVKRLQLDLIALGFTVVGTADGDFGGRTAVALREFQIEARQTRLFRDVPPGPPAVDTTEPAPMRHRGPVNGVLDHDTAQVLALWAEASGLTGAGTTPIRLNPLRVRSQHYTNAGLGAVVDDDVWTWNQVTDSGLVVCAVDYLRRQWFDAVEKGAVPAPELGSEGYDPVVLGSWIDEGSGGPVQMPDRYIHRTWASAQMTPYNCADPDAPAIPVVASQYRVVRAIAKVEMYGYFDVHNCWDIARLSMGMYHWTLGPNGRWELPAMLSHYRTRHPEDFDRDFGSWGIGIAEGWNDTQPDDSVNRAKLTGTLAMYGLHDEDGVLQPHQALPFTPATGGGAKDAYLLDWFRSWRVLHRLLTVARDSRRFQHSQYLFALIRLRTLLGRDFQSATGPDATGPFRADGTVARFGDVFTSEQAVAALLRWHVNRPDRIIAADGAVHAARGAYEAVFGTGRVDLGALPAAGADARQQALAQWLIDNAPTAGSFQNSVRLAVEYNDAYLGRLSDRAGSLIRP
ncbi:peptidoglycan-binding protein [Streptomyces sp. NPDC001380]|uniref:peptidoglycan-binding protein n=1 Tax=Streptomyces sp. NPDC001380 TaxID=3364566 RepID=UPI0036CF9B40